MEWLFLFVISWILFFLLVDFKKIKFNIWCGLFAILLQMIVDTIAMYHGWYDIKRILLFHILGSSAFFCLGPVPVVGILLAQYHPSRRWFVVANAFILTGLYSLQEYLLVIRGNVVYYDWHFHDSVFINLLIMIVLSWFSVYILNKRKLMG